MSRTILHSDMNCFYASVEMLHHPELAGKPMAVGGDPEARHGIVLTANYIAKRAGVKTGMALWQARQVCPEIIFVPPRMDLYLRFSRMAQEIYSEYTDQREPFGIDESWLDVTASTSVKGDGMKIAKEISSRIKYELGVTVSMADVEHMTACDYVGIVSGNKEPDKFVKAGFTAEKSEKVDAPIIKELPICIECKLKSYDKDTCRLIGEIVNVSVDESVLDENGNVDVAKAAPITFDPFNNAYIRLGEKVGDAFKAGTELK